MGEVANALMRAAGSQQDSADGIPSTAHRFSVTGTATAVQFDQTPYYNLLTDAAESASHIVGAAVPAESDWSTAALWRYMADNPAPLVNIHFTDFNNTSNLSAGKVKFIRKTPDGNNQVKPYGLTRFRTQDQFQLGTLTFPVESIVMDGYTYARTVFPGNATPNSFNTTWTFGATLDRRAMVPQAQAQVVVGPSRR